MILAGHSGEGCRLSHTACAVCERGAGASERASILQRTVM